MESITPASDGRSPEPAPLRIDYRKVADLIPYARNARTHTPKQIDKLAASIVEFGWTNPILIGADGGILAGHGRVLAAKQLAILEVPCVELAHMDARQRRAYVIADNELALIAGWDDEMLGLELGALRAEGFDLSLIGFDPSELSAIFRRRAARTDPDELPAPPAAPTARRGDVWLLGEHRLAVGDATSAADVGALMAGAAPSLMVTDPPYGVAYDPGWRLGIRGQIKDVRAFGKVEGDDRADWREAWALFPGATAYVWHAGRSAAEVQLSLEAAGFVMRSQIIWAKPHFAISRGDYHWQHEPCWYAVRKGRTAGFLGDRSQSTLWDIPGLNPMGRGGSRGPENAETDHGTQKPAECMRRPIVNSCPEGGVVYDPFVGSGTTIIAAEMTGRRCLALDLDPIYADVAILRWQNFTGRYALLGEQTYDQVTAARLAA